MEQQLYHALTVAPGPSALDMMPARVSKSGAYAVCCRSPCVALACGSILCPAELFTQRRILHAQRRELHLRGLARFRSRYGKVRQGFKGLPPHDRSTMTSLCQRECVHIKVCAARLLQAAVGTEGRCGSSPPSGPRRWRRFRKGAAPGTPPPARRQWHGRLTRVLPA